MSGVLEALEILRGETPVASSCDSPRSSVSSNSTVSSRAPASPPETSRDDFLEDTGRANRVRVNVRVRPPLEHELKGQHYCGTVRLAADGKRLVLAGDKRNETSSQNNSSFVFDCVHGETASQRDVYVRSAQPLVDACLEGYNATILAYGQTGAGKTYTMEGEPDDYDNRGIVPRAIETLFNHIKESASEKNHFLVRASYLQIYNDVIYDLLKPENTTLQIREEDRSKKNSRGVYVDGLSEWVVRTPQEIFKLMARGAASRATGKTKLNDMSSRSHAILRIILEQCETKFFDPTGKEISSDVFEQMMMSNSLNGVDPENLVTQRFRVAKLNLVDLAGSERVRISGATGMRLEESKKINRSLSALGNVISALTDENGRQHIPYRDSKLTRILEDSLGGNCHTAIFAMISPSLDAISETMSTLKFATRAKCVKNTAFVNEDVDKNSLLRKYEKELKMLRRQLHEKEKNVVDKRVIIELEDQKRRAEADKMAALRALESTSFEFMREKVEKQKLEEKIEQLESQVLIGGLPISEEEIQATPLFRSALDAHRNEIRAEFSAKIEDLERECHQAEQKLQQTDQIRHTVLKQRDVLAQLTALLNERDAKMISHRETIRKLERQLRETQEKLDAKTSELLHLKRLVLESQQGDHYGKKTAELQELLGVLTNGKRTNSSPVKTTPSLEERLKSLTNQYNKFREEMSREVRQKDHALQNLREENAKLKAKSSRHIPDSKMLDDLERLQKRALDHAKEDRAMSTLMQKVKTIVGDTLETDVEQREKKLIGLNTLVSNIVQALGCKHQMQE